METNLLAKHSPCPSSAPLSHPPCLVDMNTLALACTNNQVPMIKLLLSNGAKIMQSDHRQMTPLVGTSKIGLALRQYHNIVLFMYFICE